MQAALDQAAKQLLHGPSGVAPWYFNGSFMDISSPDWRCADQILVPLAFNALGLREWQSNYAMDEAARQRFLKRFDLICAELLSTLPSFSARPEAHVFIQWGDLEWDLPCLSSGRVFKVSSSKHGASEAMPYFIDDLEVGFEAKRPHTSINEASSWCSFTGNFDSHPLRRRMAEAIANIDPAGNTIQLTHTFAGPADHQRSRYLQSLRDTRFVLCPRGSGLNSVRFFETMAVGRIPVLISDETKLPLEDIIPYQEFVLFLPETHFGYSIDRGELRS